MGYNWEEFKLHKNIITSFSLQNKTFPLSSYLRKCQFYNDTYLKSLYQSGAFQFAVDIRAILGLVFKENVEGYSSFLYQKVSINFLIRKGKKKVVILLFGMGNACFHMPISKNLQNKNPNYKIQIQVYKIQTSHIYLKIIRILYFFYHYF